MTGPPWWTLFPLAVACAAGGVLTYAPARAAGWAPWAFAGLALGCGWLWGWSIRGATDDAAVFRFNLAWDAVVAAVYYALPLVAFGVRPDGRTLAGLGLIVAGVVLVKAGGR